MPNFEITADDIALLNDEQLREVIGRLCEAELRRRDQSVAHVTWGGDQNAEDGGIDVRVDLPTGSVTSGFIPRIATGFQVKAQDMPHKAVIKEMRPKGTLRPAIQDLADQGGAYIIVSSKGSAADSALRNRRAAMKEAAEDTPNADAIHLEFYDRNRVATWVRSHQGLIPWLRERIGRPICGWQSYGPWASSVTEVYLADDRPRIHPGARTTAKGLSAREGIQAMRDRLRAPRQVVRLIGLSGVGKTRLVQALFDDRAGERRLNPDLAIYTNIADSPEPSPINLATQLIAARTRAILIIDNCRSDLHRHVAELCLREDSNLSLLTVEYDVHEDGPEGTDVFKLEGSSFELIQQLVCQRFPSVSVIDARTVSEFSGGNARMALAIAGTIGQQESLAGLADEQIFQRLFVQRHAHDEALYLSGQACSLVYSFQGEDISEDSELARLAKTIERTPGDLYRSVAELFRRDLVQKRSTWRAVLPQAIANRLAAVALQNIPYAEIEAQLIRGAPERLLRSFSRRLGYLHTSNEAVAIVRRLIGPGGLLSDVANLSEFRRALFENVAPAVPGDVLAAIERALNTEDAATRRLGEPYLNLLRSLAYDSALFERSTGVMVNTLTATSATEHSHGTQLFVSLFHLLLSGTHATIEQRLGVIARLLDSADDRQRALGLLALRAVLVAACFSSSANFDFGARSRDFGYQPRTADELHDWFSAVLRFVEAVARPDHPVSPQARTALAEAFRDLWCTNWVADELDRVCRGITGDCFWPGGWLAVRRTLDSDGSTMCAGLRERLIALETALRPADLEQQVRSVVVCPRGWAGPGDHDEAGVHEVVDLGKAIVAEEELLTRLLPEIVSGEGPRFSSFGKGLLEGAPDTRLMWQRLMDARTAGEGQSRPDVLSGFLSALHDKDPRLAAQLLDEAVEHDAHSPYYPYLQVAVPIGEQDLVRLQRSLALGRTPARTYMGLAYGRATVPIPPDGLRALVLALAALPDGYDVAVEVLHARLHADGKQVVDHALTATGQDLLRRIPIAEKNDSLDYRLGKIARACLVGEEGSIVTQELCARLKGAVATYTTYASYHADLLEGLFLAQPFTTLTALCDGNEDDRARGMRILHDIRSRKDLISAIPEAELLRWCDERPDARYRAIAGVLPISHRTSDADALRWTAFALRFLERAPDPAAVLHEYVEQFAPRGVWSGSRAAIMQTNAALLDDLDGFAGLAAAVAQEKERMRQAIERERRFELACARERDERFE